MSYNMYKVDAVNTYNITYSDAISGDECGSRSIAAASCNSGMCSHVFEVPSHQSNCNSDINVTVSADNHVQSEPIKIGTVTSLLYTLLPHSLQREKFKGVAGYQ